MKILIIEPYFEGSHKRWALELQNFSSHNIETLTLPGRYWKWRMHGGAITLAQKYNNLNLNPDIIIASDMLNLPLFKSIANTKNTPIAMYFHENQITYPWSPKDRDIIKGRDHHYGFINYSSSMVSDLNLFNSSFHRISYIKSLKKFLTNFPDYNDQHNIEIIDSKSRTLYLGIDLKKFNRYYQKPNNKKTTILWNHRWEHDKNPDDFIHLISELDKQDLNFECILLGKNKQKKSGYFNKCINRFPNRILHSGYCETFEEYATFLWKSDVCPITSIQDFFGISIAEAVYCNTYPLLPDRLAYPEIYKKDENTHLFYKNKNNLIDKMKHLIQNKEKRLTIEAKDLTEKFDWSNIINTYDELFENILLMKR
ncbi:MAG: glycosyl transferase family 1 [Candidatus Marinimicrobia bacterium]|nr:glycosyl transferase family 1 [Candidatus Neomarinimicrobiota bacterium]|tara:strand:+ start:5531 stop:6637 length:1107 start_codon:yes stop_codon:yes gene_type:complete